MSGSTERERQPTDDAELARELDRRIDEAEQPESMRCGEWTISTDDAGNLRGCHSEGGCVTIAEKPPAGTDPDGEYIEPPEIVPPHLTPRIKVKGGVFSVTTGGGAKTYNVWNTAVDFEEPAGTWTHDATNFTIPVDGDYTVKVFMPWTAVLAGERSLELRKNGTIVDLDTKLGTISPAAAKNAYCRIVQDFRCVAGDVFQVGIYQDSGASVSAGGANFGDAWAQLSIIRLADSDVPEHERGTL
jgi:hypothetical protein